MQLSEALQNGYDVEKIYQLSHVDRWFLYKIAHVVNIAAAIHAPEHLTAERLLEGPSRNGFSDKQLALLSGINQNEVRDLRHRHNIRPFIRQIDTLGAEYPAQTNYLYLSYNGIEDEVEYPVENSIMILGSGSYRIGSSVEFDWCCVNAGMTLRKLGYKTIMLNYNPETVSTDYDEFDLLFFDEIRLETVLEIYDKIRTKGVIISMGGQIPNNLALDLHHAGIRVLGTSPESIDHAENRKRFSSLLDRLGVDQPRWKELTSVEEAQAFAREVKYPVLVRPSYVLSGAAMAVASNDEQLTRFLKRAAHISPEQPTVISKFLENAKEIELDAVARGR